MSARAIIWARDQRLPAPQKVVLLILASHHNPKDDKCFPSQELLAWETGLSRRAVQIALKSLVKSKHVEVEKKRHKGQWSSCFYRLHMGEQTAKKATNHAHEVRTDHSNKTAHGEKSHHAHEVRTKGYIYNTGEEDPAKICDKPLLRVVSGGAA
ncbi:MAG: helix-turn-helix domain-containing protein [Loktanella sp.]|nr:helix-turn-helix domain-containing protein [Loktanella sp.]